MLTNAHNQIRLAEYQRPSQLHMPDYLTVGKGKKCFGNNCAHGSGAQVRTNAILFSQRSQYN
eukprot:COSAG06_NODE_884_length_11783_cov_10.515919_14_plen_62_part_00